MLRPDWARWFAIRLAVVYVLLVLPWPGVNIGFSSLYRRAANAAFGVMGVKEYLSMDVPSGHHPHEDVELAISNLQTGKRGEVGFFARDWAFLPLAVGIALTLAVPPPWPGRVRSGLILLGLIVLFVYLRIAVASVYGLCAVGVFPISPAALNILYSVMLGFSATPVVSFVVPVILWLLVLNRHFDSGIAFNRSGRRNPETTQAGP